MERVGLKDIAEFNKYRQSHIEAIKDSKKDYKVRKRSIGSGPLRIDSEIKFSEDLYSMYFVTNFKTEYIYFC